MNQQTAQFYAVTDTNVLLDIHSCHDLLNATNDAHARLGAAAALNDLAVVYRRARARESLLLAIHFNKLKATTYSLHFEPVDLLTRRAPPAATGGISMESDFTSVFLHFVKDYVLPDWNMQMPTTPGTEARNVADRAYVAFAKQHALPLITNEGYGQNGIVDEKMRKLAKDSGVAVFAPKEFYQGKIDETAEIDDFLRRFKEQGPLYIKARKTMVGEDKIDEVLGWVYGYYLMILRGEVAGSSSPVKLSVI